MEQAAKPHSKLRIAIMIVAGVELLSWLPFLPNVLSTPWSEYPSGVPLLYLLTILVVFPALALAGLGLAIKRQRLRLAAGLVAVQPIALVLSAIAFGIGVMMHGF